MRYDFFVTVWGQHFVQKFIDLSLFSQLAQGNIPALANDADIHYHIYTDRASEVLFRSNLLKLSTYAKIKFYYFDEIPYRDGTLEQAILNSEKGTIKHNVQRITANHMLLGLEKSAAVLLDSDFILTDGSLARMHALRVKGYQAVMVPLLRLNETSASPILHRNMDFYVVARNLVKLCLEHMHPILTKYFVDSEYSTSYPSQLNWWVNKSLQEPNVKAGIITQCLFPHPLMVEPDSLASDSGAKYFSTMDYDYAFRAVANNNAIHLSKNSNEILICKISPEKYRANSDTTDPLSEGRMAQFILNNTNIRHRFFLDQVVSYVTEEDGDWDSTSQKALQFVAEAYEIVDTMIGQSNISDPMTLVYLKSFLGPIEDFISPQVQSRIKNFLPN